MPADAPTRGARKRHIRLLRQAVADLCLELSGARVLTEAATGPYSATAVMAALAGATVHAIARDSPHASSELAIEAVDELAILAAVPRDRIHFHRDRSSLPHDLDIVTNAGHVRPLDAQIIDRLGPFGVVSVMFEAWELRPGEIDLSLCKRRNVPVAGVWEDFDTLGVFASCASLALKLCFEAGLEVTGNKIVVISDDPFGDVIARGLRANRADVIVAPQANQIDSAMLRSVDALLVASYDADKPLLGDPTTLSPEAITAANAELVIVQFVGPVQVQPLLEAGLNVHPSRQLGPRQMAATLDYLGPRPAINLNAAGLKVGELLWKQRRDGQPFGRFASLVQPVVVPG